MGSRIWIALGFTSQFCSWQAGQKQREVDFSRTVSTGSEKLSSLEICLRRGLKNWTAQPQKALDSRRDRLQCPPLMKWKASLMIMANITIMSSFMFPPCIAGGNIFLHILHICIDMWNMLKLCNHAFRHWEVPDKISGQNVETIVSKSIAFKIGMFANIQWDYYTLLWYFALSSLGKSQDKMFGMLDSRNICWILRKVSNGRVLGIRLRPRETCGAWGRSS